MENIEDRNSRIKEWFKLQELKFNQWSKMATKRQQEHRKTYSSLRGLK